MHALDRQLVYSAFDAVLSELKDQLGPVTSWTAEQKKEVAKQVLQSAKLAFATPGSGIYTQTSQVSSHGGALLSAYLELQTLPGAQAVQMVEAIDKWRTETQAALRRG